MKIEIPDELIEDILEASEIYDCDEDEETVTEAVISILRAALETF